MAQPTDATRRRNDELRRELPFHDTQDFEDARRGFIATLSPGVIRATDGRPVWDLESFGFASAEDAPATVNPSLWRQLRLLAIHFPFEVVPGICQVRGLDLSNITFLSQVLDGLAIRIDGMCAAQERLVLNWDVAGERAVTTLNDGVLTYVLGASDEGAAATLRLDREGLVRALTAGDLSGIAVEGDAAAPMRLFALLDDPDPGFEIVAP